MCPWSVRLVAGDSPPSSTAQTARPANDTSLKAGRSTWTISRVCIPFARSIPLRPTTSRLQMVRMGESPGWQKGYDLRHLWRKPSLVSCRFAWLWPLKGSDTGFLPLPQQRHDESRGDGTGRTVCSYPSLLASPITTANLSWPTTPTGNLVCVSTSNFTEEYYEDPGRNVR